MGTSGFEAHALPRRGVATLEGCEGDRIVVWLCGDHDTSTTAELAATLTRAVALGEADVVIDLSKVDFMDVATADVIKRTRESLRLLSRSLVLRAPSARARRVLDLCAIAPTASEPSRHRDRARPSGASYSSTSGAFPGGGS